MTEVVLPQFGMGMADGTITAWHKAVGDAVVRGEPICDVEAAKAAVEVAAPCDGFLQEILVPSGTNVPVNSVIAIIGDSAAALAPAPLPVKPNPDPENGAGIKSAQFDNLPRVSLRPAPRQQVSTLPGAPVFALEPPRVLPGQSPQVEPRARRAARLHDIDLALVQGTGPDGRIVEEDIIVLSLPSLLAPSPEPAVSDNWSGAAIYQFRMRCDARPLASLLNELSELNGKVIPYEAAMARAVAIAMAKAGVAAKGIGIRSEDGSIKVLGNPTEISLVGVADRLAATAEPCEQAPAYAIEVLTENWLDEIVRIDSSGIASLSFGKTERTNDDAGEEWQVTLTCKLIEASISEAKLLLQELRQLLKKPVAILI